MKKYSILFFLISIFILPISVFAARSETDYIWITDTANIKVGNLSITDLTFKNYTQESSQSFGVTGNITNNGDETEYISKIEYYDGNKGLLCSETINQIASKGKGVFNHFSNIDLMKSYSGFYVNYYKLIIDDSPSAVIENKTPSKMSDYSYYDYTIDNYDINMIVNENNTFDVTETITAHYKANKHGIIRNIPLRNEIVRLDGTTSINKAKVTNVSVNSKYTTYKENGNFVIKIGDAKETMTGDAVYTIKYNYNIGKDPSKDYDELYFNLIGTEWDTAIGNVTFTVVMPKDFDSSKLGFSKGFKGSTTNNGIKYNVNGRTITGRYDGVLDKYEGLTIRCELEEGYFVNAGFEFNILDYIPFAFPIVFLLIALIMWLKKGKNDLVVDIVEFYPPEGKNSLDIGFLYKGKAINKDVTSLLIYLANKGYLKIEEIEEKVLFTKKKSFKIIKIKEYDGNNNEERMFFNGLFKYGNEVTKSDLYNRFYITMNKILSSVNNKDNKNKIYVKDNKIVRTIIIAMIVLTFIVITVTPMLDYEPSLIFAALLFPGIGFTIFFGSIFGNIINSKVFGIVWGLFFGGMPWALIVLPVLLTDEYYLIGYGIGIVAIIIMFIILSKEKRRTEYGNMILGKIRGFKNFLETAEKDKLEALVEKNHNYFYDILPYTYVLNVSDKWVKKFEDINLQSPDWYDGHDNFNFTSFCSFVDDTFASASSSMSSSSSDGSGSSGGGSSGGGSGGGGGSSW